MNHSHPLIKDPIWDALIIGSGVSGAFWADGLSTLGLRCLILEAGSLLNRNSFPKTEIAANSQLYWSGGIELNQSASIGFLRPKVVGGGSIVNQALLDRFDNEALSAFKDQSGVSFFEEAAMNPYYENAESKLHIEEIPEKFQNENAQIFKAGFSKLGYQCAPLKRGQKGCEIENGNDCIECLAGCRRDSKQSMLITTLKNAFQNGLSLASETRAELIEFHPNKKEYTVYAKKRSGTSLQFKSRRLILASGAIGNSALLLKSGFQTSLPQIGKSFFTHPQYMNLGIYDRKIHAEKGSFQSLKSSEPEFRKKGFKLENVFAPPVGLSMLIPGFGKSHQSQMELQSQFACIEVAVRDTAPGRIRVNSKGGIQIQKELNTEDKKRKLEGLKTVNEIFRQTGAKKIIEGKIGIGLHLMGGCSIGSDPKTSVASPEFTLHGHPRILVSDSSVFPNAPGINPSLTIMAFTLRAIEEFKKDLM